MGVVRFSDLVKSREYWEQYQKELGEKGVMYFYTLYGLYSISEAEFALAKEESWKKAGNYTERQADQDAKNILDEAKSRFLNQK